MKAADIVGKTVARVDQTPMNQNSGRAWNVDRIVFTDGSSVTFTTIEGEIDYAVEATYWPKKG